MKTIPYSGVIERIANKTGAEEAAISKTLEALEDIVEEALYKGETINLSRSFGKFVPRKISARKLVTRAGEEKWLNARAKISFKMNRRFSGVDLEKTEIDQ
ncbi:MAG: HU family DNA-binding protein [Alphaproteobacteria bacterium]|nr:HU family DNA-binding protein [Alphaproteobacteria bacterium]